LIAELLIFEYRWQNISVSNTALHISYCSHSYGSDIVLTQSMWDHAAVNSNTDFITPALWPAKSPDLKPLDYKIWSKLQERVYRSQIRDVNPLKSHLIKSGNISNRCSSMKQSGSGVHVF